MSFGNTLPEASNLASYEEQFEFLDDVTSQKIDLSGALDIIVTIASDRCRDGLQGSMLNGEVTMAPDFKSFTLNFTRTQMQTLRPMTYDLGVRLIFEYDVQEIQAMEGFLPIVGGV
jgi:hypothetical protein